MIVTRILLRVGRIEWKRCYIILVRIIVDIEEEELLNSASILCLCNPFTVYERGTTCLVREASLINRETHIHHEHFTFRVAESHNAQTISLICNIIAIANIWSALIALLQEIRHL